MNRYGISPLKLKTLPVIAVFAICLLIIAVPQDDISAQEHRPVKPEWVMPDGYPEWFHGWGHIGYIDDDEIVINDFGFPLSPYVTYHTPTNPSYAYKYSFVRGVLVGFLFNEEDEIISLWMITMEE